MAFRFHRRISKQGDADEFMRFLDFEKWDWRDALVERYPALLRDQTGRAVGRPNVGDGWAHIVARSVQRIEAANSRSNETVSITGIEGKDGALRILVDLSKKTAATAAIEAVIGLAEAESRRTCEICGTEGVLFERDQVRSTRCAAHGAFGRTG